MEYNKLVSVVITTHNREELLYKAIDSVIKQTYRNIECIVVDDASDDNIQEKLDKRYGNDIKYIYIPKEKSKGGNHARNVGVDNTKGELIAFLDDDDIWYDTKIEKQVRCYEANKKAELIYCGRTERTGTNLIDSLPKDWCRGDCSKIVLSNMICTSSAIMCSRKIFYEVGRFDEDLKFWQDYDFLIRVCQVCNIEYVNEPLIEYLINTNDKGRLSNKYYGWWDSVNCQNKKYKDIINGLSKKEVRKRKAMIYKDALVRAKCCKLWKEVVINAIKVLVYDFKPKKYLRWVLKNR